MDNYGYDYEDDEINLRDAFFYILRHLKQMLIVGLVFMLLLGGYKGYKSYSDAKAQSELIDSTTIEGSTTNSSNPNKVDLEEKKTKLLEELEAKTEQLTSYMEEDELFEMDPYNTYAAKATYFVDSGYKVNPSSTVQDIVYTNTILDAYCIKLQDKDTLDNIAKKYGINGKLSDYVTVNYSNHLLYVYAFNEDRKVASNILHDITDSIESISEEISTSISSHTVTFVSKTTYVDSQWVLDKQNSRINNITNTINSIEALNTSLDSLDTNEGFEPTSAKKALLNSFIKWGLIGLVVGVILVCAYYFIKFLMKDTVYSADELKDKTDIRVLGNIASSDKSSKYISWINKVEKRVTSTDYNLIATSIETFSNESSVLVTGDVKDIDIISSSLKELIKDKTLIFTGSLKSDINGLKALDKCNDIVLLAKCGESCYKSINDQKERLEDLNKNIVGCVVEE